MIALLAVAAATAAHASSVCTVHFRHRLDEGFVARLERALNYSVANLYMPPASLLLYVDSTIEITLRTQFNASVQTIHCGDAVERCSSSLMSPSASMSVDDTRVTMVESLEPLARRRVVPALASEQFLNLRILLHHGAYAHGIQASDCLARIEHALDGALTVRAYDETLVCVERVPTVDAMAVAQEIVAAAGDCVCFVERDDPINLANLWSVTLTQNASAADMTAANAATCVNCRPMWARGLNGNGQLIAISDTGVATDRCHFYDAAHAVPTVSGFSRPNALPADTGHRRIRAYWAYQDAADSDGHGTHVAATALGGAYAVSAALSADDFNGGAGGSRLVFVDCHSTSSLVIPTPIDTQLLEFVRLSGARIHSASWGATTQRYDDLARRVDSYLSTHPEIIFVAAAGNSGNSGLLSPALGRNVLSVGASLPGAEAYLLANGAVLTYPRDAYAADWMADFSSNSATNPYVPWLTPLISAAGGRYKWSANAFGPTGGICSPLSSCVAGLAGTSMAAPDVGEACSLTRQFFADANQYSTTAPFDAVGPLVIGTLIAGAQPTRGVFPQRAYNQLPTPDQYGRRRYQGHGRVSLVDSMPLAGDILVLANYNRQFSLNNVEHVYCVHVHNASRAGTRLRVVLAYYDRTEALNSGETRLVNDLDVEVAVVGIASLYRANGFTATNDHLSPFERVDVDDIGPSGFVRISVRSYLLGFGSQKYSLVVVSTAGELHFDTLGRRPPIDAIMPSASCSVCETIKYVGECAFCGNGRLDAGEQCDDPASPCCSPTTCRFVVGPCTRDVQGCQVDGMCDGASIDCQVLASLTLFTVADCGSAPTAAPTPAPTSSPTLSPTRSPTSSPTIAPTVAPTRSPTPVPTTPGQAPTPKPTPNPTPKPTPKPTASPTSSPTRSPTAVPVTNSPTPVPTMARACSHSWQYWSEHVDEIVDVLHERVCCWSLQQIARWGVDERTPVSPAVARLIRLWMAAVANFNVGVGMTAMDLMRIVDARVYADGVCDHVGNTTKVAALTLELEAIVQRQKCVNDAFTDDACSQTAEQRRADLFYCHDGGNYQFSTGVCDCDATHHDASQDCALLHCSGNGISVDNACVCLPGYAGVNCALCNTTADDKFSYLCVGVDRARLPPFAADWTHVRRLVTRESVLARLSGVYYNSSDDKLPDAAVGRDGFDCWCRTHASATFSTSIGRETDEALVWAHAEPRAAVATSTQPRPNEPPPPSPIPSSGGRNTQMCLFNIFALALTSLE